MFQIHFRNAVPQVPKCGVCSGLPQLLTLIPTTDRSSAEAPPQCVLASGQGYGISGVTELCAPRPGSKKLHVCKL